MAAYYISLYWYACSLAIGVMGLIDFFEPKLPRFINDLFLYGKIKNDANAGSWLARWIEVPKKWFIHFYIVGVVCNGTSVYLVQKLFLSGQPLPSFMERILSVTNSTKSANDTATSPVDAWLVILLMFIQNSRRLYGSKLLVGYQVVHRPSLTLVERDGEGQVSLQK